MIAGDFNLIFKDSDKNNANLNRVMMRRFRGLIEDLALKEIPLHGRKFTWYNHQETLVLVKLDRVLCSVDWELLFPNVLLQSAASQDSDHCPLLLGLRDNKSGKRRFHFESFWTKLDGFQEVVHSGWNAVIPVPCPFKTVELKLKETAKRLQAWSEKKVGHVHSQLALTKEVLHRLEMAQDFRVLIQAEIWLKNRLKKQALLLSSLKRTMARLRSRISWLKEGDANTKLFHLHARHRKRKNFVARLVDGDYTLTSHVEKAACVDRFYTNLIGKCVDRDRVIDLEALGLPSFELSELDAPFSEQEVEDIIKRIPADEAPGPDGSTGRFYKVCWPIIKVDMMAAISAIWGRKFDNFGRLNSAYITMIPKNDGAEMVKDFRPISLVHSFAKLITKILANRLAKRLNEMVSPNQSAFIKGRFIQDNFMLVQQTSRLLHQQHKASLLYKLDITKAFDSISWPFLVEVLKQLGFGQIWRDIICGLLTSSSTQVMLNGFPGQHIIHRRGLRQGDPLSPLLFILAMDVLVYMFSKAEEEGLLQQLSNRKKLHRIS